MGKDYYQILGLNQTATDDEIKRAYRRLALKYHPDKNQSADADSRFREIAEAYEVLSDKRKRDIFDRYGEEGLKGGPTGQTDGTDGSTHFHYEFHGDPRATFAQFFGNSNPFGSFFGDDDFGMFSFTGGGPTLQSDRTLQQDNAIEHEIQVSLEEVLLGVCKKMRVTRKIYDCRGAFKTEEKLHEIYVKPGWKAGTKITFAKEGDRYPNRIPADIVFVIRDKPHLLFGRSGEDITFRAKITLKQALCGFSMNIPTLQPSDGNILLMIDKEIITPRTVKKFNGYGLPFIKDPLRRGSLVVTFDIVFPQQLTTDQAGVLREIL